MGNDRQTKDLRSRCVLALCTSTAEFEAARRTSPITESDPTTLSQYKAEQDRWPDLTPHPTALAYVSESTAS